MGKELEIACLVAFLERKAKAETVASDESPGDRGCRGDDRRGNSRRRAASDHVDCANLPISFLDIGDFRGRRNPEA